MLKRNMSCPLVGLQSVGAHEMVLIKIIKTREKLFLNPPGKLWFVAITLVATIQFGKKNNFNLAVDVLMNYNTVI